MSGLAGRPFVPGNICQPQTGPMCYRWVETKECYHATTLNQAGVQMITIPELVAGALGSFLTSDTKSRFGSSHARLAEVIPSAARLTLECIGNSDALYHNIEQDRKSVV